VSQKKNAGRNLLERVLLFSSLSTLPLANGCYSSPKSHVDPDPYADQDGNGVPDAIGPDPELYDGWIDPPANDHDRDGLTDDVDVDDDNDLVLDDAPDQALVDAVKPIAHAQCEASAPCCLTSDEQWLERCELRTTGNLVLALAQSWADGFVAVDPAALDPCLAALGVDCSTLEPRPGLSGCASYLVGQQRGERAACDRSVDCAPGFACTLEAPGVLHDPQAVIDPHPFVLTLWSGGQRNMNDGVCLPLLEPGDPCLLIDQVCEDGLVCDERLDPPACLEVAPLGSACRVFGVSPSSDNCETGTYCDSPDDGHCVAWLSAGDGCVEDRDCGSHDCDARSGTCVGDAPVIDLCEPRPAY
jgi:hypothetical protein